MTLSFHQALARRLRGERTLAGHKQYQLHWHMLFYVSFSPFIVSRSPPVFGRPCTVSPIMIL